MTDRNVQFPNRYQLTKVAGTDDIYDLTPAPGTITEEGTSINKATLLQDATAALYGLGTDAVPDEVFQFCVRPGTILWYASQDAPSGYLICDGSVISRTDYSVLFSVIGTAFGAGDGSTTFSLPDLRAKFIRGAGTSGGYTATFGETQEATTIAAVTGFFQSVANYDRYENLNDPNTRYGNYMGGTTVGNNYIRPYNIALTPIIKY